MIDICPSFIHPSVSSLEQKNWYLGGSVWVSLMYFKWDLFHRHIKKWVYGAKNGVYVAKMGLNG